MKQEFPMISGVTKANRHQVTCDVSAAISGTDGWVIAAGGADRPG